MDQRPPEENLIHPDGELLEKIDRSNLTPLNDPGCQHSWYILDEDSGVPGHTAVACKNCPIGHLWPMSHCLL
jgi:hypothetical protein